jgi:hypothetical protein
MYTVRINRYRQYLFNNELHARDFAKFWRAEVEICPSLLSILSEFKFNFPIKNSRIT